MLDRIGELKNLRGEKFDQTFSVKSVAPVIAGIFRGGDKRCSGNGQVVGIAVPFSIRPFADANDGDIAGDSIPIGAVADI